MNSDFYSGHPTLNTDNLSSKAKSRVVQVATRLMAWFTDQQAFPIEVLEFRKLKPELVLIKSVCTPASQLALAELSLAIALHSIPDEKPSTFSGVPTSTQQLAITTVRRAEQTLAEVSALIPPRFTDARLRQVESILLEEPRIWQSISSHVGILDEVSRYLGQLDRSMGIDGEVGRSGNTVIGVRFGRNIEDTPASELALLALPDTEDLFYQRWADSQLLNTDSIGESAQESKSDRKRGSMIVCVDQSISMRDETLRVSKALALWFIRYCQRENLTLELILFGAKDQHVQHQLPPQRNPARAVLDVLSTRFRGGTDFDSVTEVALDKCPSGRDLSSTILLITDGLSHLSDKIKNRLSAASGVTFCTFVLGSYDEEVRSFSDYTVTLNPDDPPSWKQNLSPFVQWLSR